MYCKQQNFGGTLVWLNCLSKQVSGSEFTDLSIMNDIKVAYWQMKIWHILSIH